MLGQRRAEYFFNIGDGSDIIIPPRKDESIDYGISRGNIRFGKGISLSDLDLATNGPDLFIRYAGADRLTILDFLQLRMADGIYRKVRGKYASGFSYLYEYFSFFHFYIERI